MANIVEISKPMESEKMVEITDKVDLHAYIYPGDEINIKNIVLRVKIDGKFDVGLSLGPILSEKVAIHFDENGNVKC